MYTGMLFTYIFYLEFSSLPSPYLDTCVFIFWKIPLNNWTSSMLSFITFHQKYCFKCMVNNLISCTGITAMT